MPGQTTVRCLLLQRSIADSEDYTPPATIDDPTILQEIEVALRELGYAAGA